MKLRFCIVFLMLLCVCLLMAQKRSGPELYPGGSPFPPGKEPSLTHIVDVFWTTLSGMETRICVQATGDRPTQLCCVNTYNEKEESVTSGISPDCSYKIRISGEEASLESWHAIGCGNLTVRVFGFKREDFDNPPVVSAQYFKDGRQVGKTEITAKPVPLKLQDKTGAEGTF